MTQRPMTPEEQARAARIAAARTPKEVELGLLNGDLAPIGDYLQKVYGADPLLNTLGRILAGKDDELRLEFVWPKRRGRRKRPNSEFVAAATDALVKVRGSELRDANKIKQQAAVEDVASNLSINPRTVYKRLRKLRRAKNSGAAKT